MARSLWKGPFIHSAHQSARNSVILPKCVGYTYYVHNGKTRVRVSVTSNMVGHKFGEFALTRKLPKHKIKHLKFSKSKKK